ncbi:hypothetical protein C4D60_Mb05t11360 [Musa balbisiana]|uniref:Uncharacterized protein n=1 Tax=Musa balbisiana TaxID=52838 RepID=A0A4S8JVC2_MUSBA|nr:hypothetical protein C4D60_Mb05t11360 [Musa balbisiana]
MDVRTDPADRDSQRLRLAPVDPPSATANTDHDAHARLSSLGLAVLTCSSVTAVYRSRDDPSAVAFVVAAYADLLLLLRCVRCLEGGNAADRPRLKAAVWCLATLLTLMFSYKVAAIMPLPVAVTVWSMAAAVCLGGFWALFLCQEPPSSQSNTK